MRSMRTPSPAMVVALVALFVALSGTAVAAGVVPLAKRALTADKAKVADNAKKLGGKTSAQLLGQAAAMPGPAAAAAGLVSVKTGQFSIAAESGQTITAACAAGEKAIGGGYTYDGGLLLALDSVPSANQAGWAMSLVNLSDTEAATGTVQAVCLK